MVPVMQVCERLPVITVKWQAPQLEAATVPPAGASGDESDEEAEPAEQQWQVRITLQRQAGKASSGRGGTAAAGSRARVYAPRYRSTQSLLLQIHVACMYMTPA